MKFTQKITILVILQITLIVTSSLIIVHFESQINHTGNIVNVAGKNRLLTTFVQIEVHHDPSDITVHHDIFETLDNLEQNIYHLKYGGKLNNIETAPLPERFDYDWNVISQKFTEYKDKITLLRSNEITTNQQVTDIISDGNQLLILSDVLAENLGNYIDEISIQLILLQIILGSINVITHIFMIYFILRIFNRYTDETIRQEKFVTIGEFAAMIAHDMRNPLGTIRNSITLIQNNPKTSIRNETDRINRAIKRMSHQIEGVLNYVRTISIISEPASILSILHQCMAGMVLPQNITLTLPDEDDMIPCDAEKIEFVFTNIMLNAVQAIGNDTGYITVKLEKQHDMTVLSFENSGPAIPKKDIEQLFDPLFTTKMQGTGLGLTSCKNIIERHNGTITASNHPVTFTITLPKTGA